MTGKIGKSHPHFQAKHRVSPQFLAGGGITSLGLRFSNVASGEPVRRLLVYNSHLNTEEQLQFSTFTTVF